MSVEAAVLSEVRSGLKPDVLSSSEKFRDVRLSVVPVILDHIHPTTGLLPAATKGKSVATGHYDHAWVRDTSLGYLHLLNSTRYGLDQELDGEIKARCADAIGRNLDLFAGNPWNSAFAQEVGYYAGTNHTYLTGDAPPIHMNTDGSSCSWWTQNQPDSWGDLLNATGTAVELGVLVPTDEQQETVKNIAEYLVKIRPEIFKASTMWEGDEVHSPASLSNTIAIKAGLRKILPLFRSDKAFTESVSRKLLHLDEFIGVQFPVDYTVPKGHHSKTDLATLVAMGADDSSYLGYLSQYFISAKPELGNGLAPGKRRYSGDNYYNRHEHDGEDLKGAEAVWPMGDILESILMLRHAHDLNMRGSKGIGGGYAARGIAKLERVLADVDRYGYYPELLTPVEVVYSAEGTRTEFKPNGNDLLWNRALVAENVALAQRVSLQLAA